MMETVLYVRALLVNLYKRWQDVFIFLFKCYIGLLLFTIIGTVNMPLDELARFDSFFTSGMTLALAAFVFAILPPPAAFALLAFDIAIQVSMHLELSIMLLLLMICLILFYVRNAPKESWLIIMTVLCFYYRIPYAAPIFAGLYFPLTSAIPVIIGVYIWEFAPRFLELMKTVETAGFDVVQLTSTAGPAVQGLLEIATDSVSWVFIAFVFAMTVLIVYVVSHLTMDYAKELSIIFGGLLCMIGLFLVQAIADIDLGGGMIFVFSVLSILLMLLVRFFDIALDYKKAERVEFSDDDNYYYVRVIPKLIVTEPKKPEKPAEKSLRGEPDEYENAPRSRAFEYDFIDDEDDSDDYRE